MSKWHKTSCVCCAQNCGLEVLVEDNQIIKVKPDKDNPRSEGYVCRKGWSISHYQHHADRLEYPLKRVGSNFERISWDQAIDEIASKLRQLIDTHGPKSLAYMGGGGQGCHFEAAFAVRLLRALGSQYHYNALAQELTGMFWVQGRVLGRQYLLPIPDHDNTDMLVAWGWNGWMSHQMPQARRALKKISNDPDKLLVVIDPRRTETARLADIHLPIRPGTDALLTKAMISIILDEGLQQTQFIKEHCSGFQEILPWFKNFDAKKAVEVCELSFDDVAKVSRLFATRKSSMHPDLGVFMNRHSTVTSYLQAILLGICGRIGVSGGVVTPGHLMPLGSHSDERSPKTWRTVTSDFPAIMGTFPPNVMPEEILSENPERLRAVIVSGSNPLRSYADTTRYEEAFSRLDLLVTIEVAMTETARLSHYVLPAKSAYEKWDATFFAWNFPEIYFQMRSPAIAASGEQLEESEIDTRLAEKLGLLPDIPQELYVAAQTSRGEFAMALLNFIQAKPNAAKVLPFIVGKTLGPALGSMNKAALWGLLQTAPADFRANAARAGFDPGLEMGEEIFDKLMESPQGLWIGQSDPDNLKGLKTADQKVNLYIPELSDWVNEITPEIELRELELSPDYSFILMAGRHIDENANTIMRDPSWNTGRSKACVLAIHPDDAAGMQLSDGDQVRITTKAGSEIIEIKIEDACRRGQVVLPHGFGLVFQNESRGINVNRLTAADHRDRLAATPLHRYVPCRVEKVG